MGEHRRRGATLAQVEPAVVRGVVTAVVSLLVSTGLVAADVVDVEAVVVVVVTLAPILQALWTRRAVTPVAKLRRPPA